MNTEQRVTSDVMAALIGLTNEEGLSIADRMSVTDLWLVIQTTVPIVRRTMSMSEDYVPFWASTDPQKTAVWRSRPIREFVRDMKKIQAIKEARTITGFSLKEAKDVVEQMEAEWKASGGTLW